VKIRGWILAMIERIVYAFVSWQQRSCNFAVPTGPMEQDFLLLLCQIIWGIGLANILGHAAGRVTEEKALESLCPGGFVYCSITEGLFVQLNVCGRSAEDSLDDFLAGLGGSPDLLYQQAHSLQ
jgi:hypothetical protein